MVDLLAEGTKSHTAQQLEGDLLESSATLDTDGLLESSIVTLTTVTRYLGQALDLFRM